MRSLLTVLCIAAAAAAAAGQDGKHHPAVVEFVEEYSNPDPFVRRDLVLRLSRAQDEEAVQLLVNRALADDSPDVRYAAAEALSKMRSPEALKAVIEGLEHPSAPARAGVLDGLGGMKWAQTDPPLEKISELLLNDSSEQVRTMAAQALGRIGDKEAVPALCKALKDRYEDVVVAASDSLALLKDHRAVDPLLSQLHHRSWRVQVAVLYALSQIRSKKAVDPIIDYLGKAEGRPREDARRALVAITQRTYGSDAATWRDWWDRVKEGWKVPAEGAAQVDEEPDQAERGGYDRGRRRGYHRLRITSNRLLFVIDISTSMKHPIILKRGVDTRLGKARMAVKKIKIAREELAFTLRGLTPKTSFNVVAFETNIRKWRQDAVRATPSTVAAAIRWMERQKPREPGGRMRASSGRDSEGRLVGRTNTYGALRVVFGLSPEGKGRATPGGKRRSRPSWDTCYFLTDGEPTEGAYTKPEELLAEVARWHKLDRIQINTIGMNATGSMRTLLDGLARITGGESVYLGR